MSRTLALLLIAAGLAAAPPAGARQATAPQAAPPKPAKTLVYLEPGEVDARLLLPPPPADGSPRALAEIAELRRIAASATAERKAQARWDDDHEDPSLLTPVFGKAFDLAALPATSELLMLVQTDAAATASAAKKAFPRRRPWAVDATIKTCDPDDKPLTSYPSGHATLGYALTLTMAQALPARAPELLARGADYAYSREVCGSHFASDTQASQALATAMVTRLLEKSEFRAKLRAATAELASRGLDRP